MNTEIYFKVKRLNEFSIDELYNVLRLRSEVFVVEQNCVYQDIDGKDKKALHVVGFKKEKVIVYTRLFDAGDYFNEASIGRVVVSKNERQFGYGHDLIRKSIEVIKSVFGKDKIKISAQSHLNKFYNSHGFIQEGKEYLEDNIPHILMIKE